MLDNNNILFYSPTYAKDECINGSLHPCPKAKQRVLAVGTI
jgi:hypothetical protein